MAGINNKFRRDIDRFIRKSKGVNDDFVRAVVINLDQRLVLKSPVDSGMFRSNWVIGNGSVDMSTSDKIRSPETIRAEAGAEVSSISINGQTIFITNALPYAYRLEYEGWSQQAPQGMVRITLAEINSVMREAAFEVKK